MGYQYTIIGHLENQFPDEADDIIDPFRHFCLCGYCCLLRIVVDGRTKVLHAVYEFVPPVGILTNSLNLLGCLYTVLNLTESFQVIGLFLCYLTLHGGYLLVLRLCHGLGGSFQSLTRSL